MERTTVMIPPGKSLYRVRNGQRLNGRCPAPCPIRSLDLTGRLENGAGPPGTATLGSEDTVN